MEDYRKLHDAINDLCIEDVEKYSKKVENINYLDEINNKTFLHQVCDFRRDDKNIDIRLKIAQLLIDNGSDVNMKVYLTENLENSIVYTPLHRAIYSNSLKMVKLLIKNGADTHNFNIYYCMYLVDFDIIEFLIKHGIKLDEKDYFLPGLLLHYCKNDQYKHLKSLFSFLRSSPKYSNPLYIESIINDENKNGDTALMISCSPTVDIRIFNFLIKNGANVDIQTKDGYTPIYYIFSLYSYNYYFCKESLINNLREKAKLLLINGAEFDILKFDSGLLLLSEHEIKKITQEYRPRKRAKGCC